MRSLSDTVVYSNVSIVNLLTVDCVSSGNCVVFVFHGDETESTGSLGSLVHNDGYFSDSAMEERDIIKCEVAECLFFDNVKISVILTEKSILSVGECMHSQI